MKPKRQDLPETTKPSLRVAATPIGNLGDVSLRLRQAFDEAKVILCEDTRRTRELLSALQIPAPALERFDAHAAPATVEHLVARARGGESFVLVSDAGTPGVADPGARLVRAFLEADLKVEPIPGPSAVAVFLSICGADESPSVFWGFFPRKRKERQEALLAAQEVARQGARLSIWFESPERILDALEDCSDILGGLKLSASIVKELTKRFERIFRGELAQVVSFVRAEVEREGARGEWIFALEFPEQPPSPILTSSEEEWLKALKCLLLAEVSSATAARIVSQRYGAERQQVYRKATEIKKSS